MKFSQFLEDVLRDFEICEKDPDYEINMSNFLDRTRKICKVCLAGAYMAVTLKSENLVDLPSFHECKDLLYAIDSLRNSAGVCHMFLKESGDIDPLPTVEQLTWNYIDYHEDPIEFKTRLKSLLERLKNENV